MTNYLQLLGIHSHFTLKKEEMTEKIGLSLIGISLLMIFLIMSLSVLYVQQKHLREFNANGFTLTNMIADYSLKVSEKDGVENLFKLIGIMGSRRGLVYGMIMDLNGQVTAHTESRLVGRMLNDPVSKNIVSSNNPLKQVYEDPRTKYTIYEFSRPIYQSGKRTGSVRLGFTKDMDALFSDNDIKGLLALATLIFSLVPIYYYLMRNSVKPLGRVNDELKNLLEKNEFRKIPVNSGGGMRKFIERINQVIYSLEDKYKTLSVSYEDIEISNKVLSYEKERIESIIDSIGDGIMVTDSAGNIILVNSAMAHLIKYSEKDVIGKTVKDCFDNEEILSFIEKNQFNGSAFARKNLEISLKHSGRENILLISYLPLLNPEENVLGNIIIVRDITEQKMARQNQSDFVAHVSHELRTPLNTIKSYIELVMDDEVNDRKTKIDFYNTITDEADRLARLIGNLLNISKIEMGSLMINKDLIKSREFFTDIVKSIEQQAFSKGIKMDFFLPDKLSPLVMDKDLLRIAVTNILGNAIKYTPSGGTVTFKVEEDEGSMRIDIIDTGYGISDNDLPRIFDKFFRSSDEKIRACTGNGLGLALSREIVRLHNGTINVDSTLGQGTHFTLTLPLEDSPRISSYDKNFSSLINN